MVINNKSIRAYAPASIGNVSCGFDILGIAVEAPGDEVELTLTSNDEVVIKKIIGDGGRLPMVAEQNTAGVAVQSFLKSINSTQGVDIVLHKNLPLGSGMGSSAASAVAALVAINHLMGNPYQKKELLTFALDAERVACGAGHADNAAPCLLGGCVLVREYTPLDIVEIPTPDQLFCTLVHPHLEVKTADSRRILRKMVPISDAVTQWGNVAGLVAGLMLGDYPLIGRSLKDVIAEPIRSVLIPGFDEIKIKTLEAGALGSGISGSGPTLFAFSTSAEIANLVGKEISTIFSGHGLESDVYVSNVNKEGARLIQD
jgi:homoserine kinase